MNAKEMKKFRLLKEILPISIPNAGKEYLNAMASILDYDISFAYEVWEYYLCEYEKSIKFGSSEAHYLVDETAKLFREKDENRHNKAIQDNPVIRAAVLRFTSNCFSRADLYGVVLSLTASGKVEIADDCLKAISKNESKDGSFEAFMLKLTDDVISEFAKKANGGKTNVPRKISTLILSNASKLKSAPQNLIKQRFKELK